VLFLEVVFLELTDGGESLYCDLGVTSEPKHPELLRKITVILVASPMPIRNSLPGTVWYGWNKKMSTRLNMALQRLETAVSALENKAPVSPDTSAMTTSHDVNGEIRAIRELVDEALGLLTEEGKSPGGTPHD